MKKAIIFSAILMTIFLIGCSKQPEEKTLTRIDVQTPNDDGSYEDVIMILEQADLDAFEEIISKVKWQPNTKAEMSRLEDFKAIFFYEIDKNMPESLVEYQIWFIEGSDTAELISNKESESYGKLDAPHTKRLKEIIDR